MTQDKKAASWNAAAKGGGARGTGSFYAEGSDSRGVRIRKFAIRNMAAIVTGMLLLLVWLTLGSINDNRASTLEGQRGDIVSLQQQVKMIEDKNTAARDVAISEATGGLDSKIKADDDKVINEMMKQALSWSGLQEYLKRRASVMKDYGFSESSDFMKAFMPGEDEGVARKAESGKTYSAFDATLSSQYVGSTSYVTATDAGSYSYFTVVEMRSKASSGSEWATGQIMMTYDMISGKPNNVNAYIAPNGVERSG